MGACSLHKIGVVQAVGDNELIVRISSAEACGQCGQEQTCSLPRLKTKNITIRPIHENFSVGESVKVIIDSHTGTKAVLLAYVFPLLLLLVTLVVAVEITHREGLSGLLAVLVLLPYYGILWLCHVNIEKVFRFSVEKV